MEKWQRKILRLDSNYPYFLFKIFRINLGTNEDDGVAEVWFDSEEALLEGMSSPEGQKLGAALLEDEGNFIDHSKSSAFIVEEHQF